MQLRLVALAAIMAGCSMNTGGSDPVAESVPAAGETGLHLRLAVENAAGELAGVFAQGETASFVFVLSNESTRPETIRFTFPPHRITVMADGETEAAWVAFHGQMFPQVMGSHELAPGESTEFRVDWDLHFAESPGTFVPAGQYQAQGEFIAFAGDGKRVRARLPPVAVTVRNAR